MKREWTIKACPKCGAQETDAPRDCDHCERGGRLWEVEVVPAEQLRRAVEESARLRAVSEVDARVIADLRRQLRSSDAAVREYFDSQRETEEAA